MARFPTSPTRDHAIAHTRRRLQRESFPRLQMALLVALTGGAGFLASFTLLHAGVHGMALRYPLALGVAYLFFLLLLWLWLRTKASDWLDLPLDLGRGLPSSSRSPGPAPFRSGGGGDFGGGGASASFAPAEVSGAAPAELSAVSQAAASTDLGDIELPSAVGDAAGAVADADNAAVPLLILALVLGLALASLWVVWTAPALFAEVLVDGALSFTLYRHLRRSEPRHWFATALRRTVLPFAITAVFLALVGAGLSAAAPGAHSIGEVVRGSDAPR